MEFMAINRTNIMVFIQYSMNRRKQHFMVFLLTNYFLLRKRTSTRMSIAKKRKKIQSRTINKRKAMILIQHVLINRRNTVMILNRRNTVMIINRRNTVMVKNGKKTRMSISRGRISILQKMTKTMQMY
uniref:Uncharacterized protein n=1 Tax=Cacopsylla melanoneura TaxID=428564 RepID=A0A8D8T4A2_9HEMI